MALFTCRPDRFMNEAEMSALFDDFDLSLRNGHSSAAVFSSLVNNVRQVYMSALLDAREELLDQHKEHVREVAALTRERRDERRDERGSPPEYGTTTSLPDPVAGQGAGGGEIGQAPEGEITWPAITFPLHIGSYSIDYRRDEADWKDMNRDGWTERLIFNVFKYQEPGTSKVSVTKSTNGSRRIMVSREPWAVSEWEPLLEFYAYDEQRPGTYPIWVAYHSDPDRCIFMKGGRADILPGWERRFEFWVPK